MGKRYKSVSEMVRQLSDDKEFRDNFDRQISDKTLSKTLFAMRCSMGITQSEMASKLNCTQSRVSKLENSRVDAIKVSDLIAYAEALGLNLSISFHKEMTSVESVKFHAFQIKKHLDYLADLAYRDDDIFKGVKDFYNEYIVNILRLFKQSVDKLPKKNVQKGPVLEVCAPTDIPDDEVLLHK
ncbi:MAG: helix-turn-helix transcriptional regulator [Spirochaetes bacterium]|nr:helix-turn-helix transcriptional regulator [Spirochaetota bacterium]